MKRKFTKLMAAFALLLFLAPPMIGWAADETITFSELNLENGVQYTTIEGTDCTLSFGDGANDGKYYTTGAAIRVYGGGHMTVSSTTKTIERIELTFGSGDGSNTITTDVNTYSNGTWQGSAQSSVTFNVGGTSGHRRIASVAITYTGGDIPTTYTVTYNANVDGVSPVVDTYNEGATVTLRAANTFTNEGYTFSEWNTQADGDGDPYDAEGTIENIQNNFVLYAIWMENEPPTPSGDEITDVLTNSNTINQTTNTYTSWTATGFVSGAEYAGQSAGGNGTIQLRSNNSNSGIVSTTSGGKVTHVAVGWYSGTSSGRTLNVYGSNTVYTNPTDLYNSSNQGTLLGTIVCGTSTELAINGDYAFIGVRSASGAMYLNSVSITWEANGTPAPSISASNVEVLYDATLGSISYTINNPVDGGNLTATTESEWLTIGTVGETVPFTCTVNEAGTAREGVVTLTYTYGDNETVTKDVTVTQAGNPNAVMTIAEVRALGTGTTVATKGVVTSISVSGNNKTAYMQDNTAGIVAFGPFTTEVAVGDEIRVEGELTEYHGLLEIGKNTAAPTVTVLSQNNTVTPVVKTIAEISNNIQAQLVKVENATVTAIDGQNTTIAQGENTIVVRGISGVEYAVNDVLTLTANVGCYDNPQLANPTNVEVQHAPSITFDPDVVDLDAEMQTIQIPFTYDNIVVTNYESFAVHHYDAEGEEIQNTPETPWYIPGVTGTNDDGYNLTVFVSANEGEARSAYMKVSALDAGGTTVYSNLVTVNQAAYVAPFAPVLYTRATEIVSGQHYIIVGFDNEDHDNAYAMGEQKNNNRAAVLISEDGTTATVTTADVHEVVITALEGDDNGYYTIEDGGYLYAASSSSNYLRTKSELDDNGKWKIAMENGEFSIAADKSSNRNVMQFNYASKLFSCYASASQKPVYLYVKSDEAPNSYTLNITGYGENEGGYVLIASPIDNLNPATIEGMTTGDFDLYYFKQDASDGLEWINYEAGAFNLVSGKGYLYANSANVTLTFAGKPYTGNGQVDVIAGYNLVGNPFAVAATLEVPYYRLNAAGSELNASTESSVVDAMEGVFVQATEAGYVNFTTSNSGNGKSNAVVMNLSRNRGAAIDRAIVRFDEGQQLPKFQLNPNSTKLYIPQGNKDYAIVRSAAQGEMPVSFRASENGTYTLAVEAENVEMNYLHLIDNMTGADVDLLATPNYTFEARTNDYTSRFRLVFSANGTTDNEVETFAYFNGSNWTVNNLGEATLQVVDVTGRTVSCETINGNATISLNQTPGVYMFRLVSGNGVKVQKVVVK